MLVKHIITGQLKLELESDDDIEQLKSDYEKYNDWGITDLLEPYSCNGSYAFFDAGNGNPFVGLTDVPCIAEQLDYLDDGQIEVIGKFWYYSDYMVSSFIEELLTHGYVLFDLAND